MKKEKFKPTEDNLLWLSDILIQGEEHHREGIVDQCLEQYKAVAQRFETLNDYETASYFYQKCLDVSEEHKSAIG